MDPPCTLTKTEKLIILQLLDAFCSETLRPVDKGCSHRSKSKTLIVRTVKSPPQIVIPHYVHKEVLNSNHQATLAGHSGGGKLSFRNLRHYFWSSLTLHCYVTSLCPHCAQNSIMMRKNVVDVTLFPANAPLESVSIDTFGELIDTPHLSP